jgi:hypothetical protein
MEDDIEEEMNPNAFYGDIPRCLVIIWISPVHSQRKKLKQFAFIAHLSHYC